MSVANPITAGSEIAKSSISTKRQRPTSTEDKSSFGEFTGDIVNISSLGKERLQKENQIEASRQIDEIANEVIRVSSTIGRNKSQGNLSNAQATELYNKIAALL